MDEPILVWKYEPDGCEYPTFAWARTREEAVDLIFGPEDALEPDEVFAHSEAGKFIAALNPRETLELPDFIVWNDGGHLDSALAVIFGSQPRTDGTGPTIIVSALAEDWAKAYPFGHVKRVG